MNTSEVVKVSGATPRMLQWWCERGHIAIKFRGHFRDWDRETAEQAMLMLDLRRKRVCQERRMSLVMREFRKRPAARYLVLVGDRDFRFLNDAADALQAAANARGPVVVVKIRRLALGDSCQTDA